MRLPAILPHAGGRPPLALVALFAMTCDASAAGTERWPVRPIRLVHGFIAGGNVDISARLLAAPLSEILGQQVVVDGRPGAGGTTAAGMIARSEPDGYTLFLMASGHSTAPALYRKLAYDPVNDFTMISLVATFPFTIVAGPTFNGKSIQDLVAMAKQAPGRLDYGTGGVGTGMHLASVLFQARAGVQLNHVPYKGGNAAPVAMLAGEVPLVFNTPSGSEGFTDSGRMRVLAITTPQRWGQMPNVPTVAETVIPGFDVRGWVAVAAPKGLPRPLVGRLNQAVQAALKRPEVIDRLGQMGTQVSPTSAAEAQQFLASEVARWIKVVRDANIPPQG
jgi:tripartite-type tricarboxylate transporter receptor subunit TctC